MTKVDVRLAFKCESGRYPIRDLPESVFSDSRGWIDASLGDYVNWLEENYIKFKNLIENELRKGS